MAENNGDVTKRNIALFVDAARTKVGSGNELSDRLFAEGIRSPRGRAIGENTVANWVGGWAQPPAAALLTIARVTGLSLDLLAGLHGPPRVDEIDLAGQTAEIKQNLLAILSALEGSELVAATGRKGARTTRRAVG